SSSVVSSALEENNMLRAFVVSFVAVAALMPRAASAQSTIQGQTLFEQHCMVCHGNPAPDSRAPNREALKQFTPERVLAALTTGPMADVAQAAGLTDAQKRILAEAVALRPLGSTGVGAASALKNRCSSAAPLGDLS